MGQSGKKCNKKKGVNRRPRYSLKNTDIPPVSINGLRSGASSTTASPSAALSLSSLSVNAPSPMWEEQELASLLQIMKQREHVRKNVETALDERDTDKVTALEEHDLGADTEEKQQTLKRERQKTSARKKHQKEVVVKHSNLIDGIEPAESVTGVHRLTEEDLRTEEHMKFYLKKKKAVSAQETNKFSCLAGCFRWLSL